LNRHRRRFEEKRLRTAALKSRPEIAALAADLKARALVATDPLAPPRAVMGGWVVTLSAHDVTDVECERAAFAEHLAMVLSFGWSREQIATLTGGAGRFWICCCSLEGRPRSSCDDDWKNLGIIHDALGVPAELAEKVILATPPDAVHHFCWREGSP